MTGPELDLRTNIKDDDITFPETTFKRIDMEVSKWLIPLSRVAALDLSRVCHAAHCHLAEQLPELDDDGIGQLVEDVETFLPAGDET